LETQTTNNNNNNYYINTVTSSSSNLQRNRTLPNIFKVELRKSKQVKDFESRNKKDFFNTSSKNLNFNYQSLNTNSSFSGDEVINSTKDNNLENKNLKSYQMDHKAFKSYKNINMLERDYENFFIKLKDKAKKFQNLCMKELNRKSEFMRKKKLKEHEDLRKQHKRIMRLIECQNENT